jgi:hypothetical protein
MSEQGEFDFGPSLSQARAYVMANLDDGVTCPCCGRYCRKYKRTMYGSQGRELIRLYWLQRKCGDPYRYFSRHIAVPWANNGDLCYLRHWGLLELEPNEDPSKKDSGNYRITSAGNAFVEGKLLVPKALFQYNEEVTAWADERTSIREVLGKKFDYDELMRRQDDDSAGAAA